jgi:hypothetical protein
LTRQSPTKKTSLDGWRWGSCPIGGMLMVPDGGDYEFLGFTDALGGALDDVSHKFDLLMPGGLRETRRSCDDMYRE